MTHADLVQVAARWLRTRHRCGVVLTEHRGNTLEIPDAIGWRWSHSVQVECKVSVSDFRADAHKAGRRHDRHGDEYRQASERWYLTPAGLIAPERVPGGWGLAEWDGRRVRAVVPPVVATRAVCGWQNEVQRLVTELRRYQAQGIRYKTIAELQAAEGGQG